MALQSFFQKVVEIKNKKNFTLKKPFVTPNFWCRNFSRIHHFWVWNFLSSRITVYLVWKTENAPKLVLAKKWSKIKPRVIQRLVFGSFWHQKRTWFIIAYTCAKSPDLECFGWIIQNITYGAFFPLSFCQKIQISYQNLKILRNKEFWNSLSSYMLCSKVIFKILFFSIFLNHDMKFVFFDKNWVGKMPHKWYFG